MLRREAAGLRAELKALRSERDVLQFEAYGWKKDKRETLDKLAVLQGTTAAMTDELMHFRRQQNKSTAAPSYTEVRSMFDAVDADGSGSLDADEVAGLAESLLSPGDWGHYH